MNAEEFLSYYEYLKIYSHIQHREMFDHNRTINKVHISIHSGQWNVTGREGEHNVHFNSMGKISGCGYALEPDEALKGMATHEKALFLIAQLLKSADVTVKQEPIQLTMGGI